MLTGKKVITELSESLTRTKRGILAEKNARKTDLRAIITELTYIKENLKDSLNNQNEMIENQNDTTKSQNDMIKNQNDMIKNQNEIIKNQNDTIKNQNDMIKIQNEMFSRIIAIQNANNDLRTKCENREQNFEQTMKNKLLPFKNLSEQIADINKTTQYIVTVAIKVAEITDLSVKLVGGMGHMKAVLK